MFYSLVPTVLDVVVLVGTDVVLTDSVGWLENVDVSEVWLSVGVVGVDVFVDGMLVNVAGVWSVVDVWICPVDDIGEVSKEVVVLTCGTVVEVSFKQKLECRINQQFGIVCYLSHLTMSN